MTYANENPGPLLAWDGRLIVMIYTMQLKIIESEDEFQ
jgi:hypothetical protein